jgi:hypothetical protein
MDPSKIGRALQALRKVHSGGRKPRTVAHNPELKRCTCVDCRKARGQYPQHLIGAPKKKPARPNPKKE